ncbi:hypothetical protein FS837_006498 [Tulasnella sp. UAMH 9824]|nr:hypothetical protein FS837_006498 [Tulasnella sp. UAMH 9824]
MTGDLPYQETSADYAIMAKIFESTLPQVDGTSRLSECLQVWELMQRCWKVNPQNRPTAQMCKTTVTYLPRCTPTSATADNQFRRAELLENLADLEIWKGNLVKSFAHLDEALSLYEQEADSRGIASVLRKQAVAAYRNDEDNKARDKATAALELFRSLEDPLGIADASFWLGCSILVLDSDDYEALRHLNQSLETYRAHEYDIGIAHCLERIATFQRINDEEEEALLTLNECLTAASRSGDRLGVARALRSLAITHYDLDNSTEAASACLEAIKIAWSIGWEGGLASALWRYLDIKRESGDLHEAGELFRESISITRQRGLRYGLASSLWVLGDYLVERSKFDEATAAYKESWQLFQEMSRPDYSKGVASDIVELKSSQGDWSGAMFWIDHVIAAHCSETDHEELSANLLKKGGILLELQRHDEAALHFEASIAISIENEFSWDEELEKLCALPKTAMKWERRLPLSCDLNKLQRRRPQLSTASLKLPIPLNHGDLDRSISATSASKRSIPFNFSPRQSSHDIE